MQQKLPDPFSSGCLLQSGSATLMKAQGICQRTGRTPKQKTKNDFQAKPKRA
jgi:hypothetical protein